MGRLKLERAIAFFDLETTGTDPATDRIVEIAVLRLAPDGAREMRSRRINPERPIPPDATRVHGITDEAVRDQPTFRQVARSLLDFLGDADLGGFNVLRFDVPLLDREFRDAGLELGLERRRIVDTMTIYHRKERRDLVAASRFYLGREHGGAHRADADVALALDVLEAQLARYPDLPGDVAGLEAWQRAASGAVDREGKLVWRGGEATFAFGRHQGRTLRDVARETPDYLEWIAGADFPAELKAISRRALDGEFPAAPRAEGQSA